LPSQINIAATTGLLQYVAFKDLKIGEPLFFQGDLPDAYYCVLSGSLSLFQFQGKAESKEAHKKYRSMPNEAFDAIIQTRELLVPGVLGDEVAILRSGIGLGELSLLGIGNIHRACAAVAVERTTMLVVNPTLYRDCLRNEHLRVLNIRDKIDVLSSANVFKNWIPSTITNLAVRCFIYFVLLFNVLRNFAPDSLSNTIIFSKLV
jgi:CRP-like cAMP-binding protein